MNAYMKSDLMRYYGKTDALTFCKGLLLNRTFRFQCILRLDKSKHPLVRAIGFGLWKINLTRRNIHIEPQTRIGYGLYIGHGGPVVVHPTAVIGDNCNLSQFTTIGSNENHAATIGDNVYIGPNVCIVENCTIGNNVTIGAGSVVTKDIPDNATAVGNYAKVIHYNNPGKYVHNKWEARQNV